MRFMKKIVAAALSCLIMAALFSGTASPASMTAEAAAPCWDWETVPHYNQKKKPWAPLEYWASTVEKRGCGPCSMASAVSGITGKTVTPGQLIPSRANGCAPPMLSFVGEHYGIRYKSIPKTKAAYRDALKSKKMIWVTIRGKCASGPWETTVKGHYILLYGYKKGKCKIMDSNGDAGQAVAGEYCIRVRDAVRWTQSSVGPIALWGKKTAGHKWAFYKCIKKTAAGHTSVRRCTKCHETRRKFVPHTEKNTQLTAIEESLYFLLPGGRKAVLPRETDHVFMVDGYPVAAAFSNAAAVSWEELAQVKYRLDNGEETEGWQIIDSKGWEGAAVSYDEETGFCSISFPAEVSDCDISACELLSKCLYVCKCKTCGKTWKKRIY